MEPRQTPKAPENEKPVTPSTPTRERKGLYRLRYGAGSPGWHEDDGVESRTARLKPTIANPTLRLSTASLGAVKRLGTPSSVATGDSFYSAVGTWGGDEECKDRYTVSEVEDEGEENDEDDYDDGVTSSSSSEDLEKEVIILEELSSDKPCSLRRASFDTTIYEPSSVASSPQQKLDHSFHLISPLSPPPRFLAFRASSSGASSFSTSPNASPASVSPARTGNASELSSRASTVRQSRVRCCSYTSLHTGIRCNAPAYEMQFLCARHLHRCSSPSAFSTMERRKRDVSIEPIGQRWPSELFRGETLGERQFYGSYDASPEDSVPLDSSFGNIYTSSRTSRISEEYQPRFSGIYSTQSPPMSSLANGNDTVGPDSPLERSIDNVAIINNTVIDWKTSESRRKEYEEADRRKKGMWNWVRRRIMSLCCVREPKDFWDGDSRNDNGSVRRYRLVLPEEKPGSGVEAEEQKPVETGKSSGISLQRIVRRASLSDVSRRFYFGKEKGGVKVLERVASANSHESSTVMQEQHSTSSSVPASPLTTRSKLISRAQSEDGRAFRNRLQPRGTPSWLARRDVRRYG